MPINEYPPVYPPLIPAVTTSTFDFARRRVYKDKLTGLWTVWCSGCGRIWTNHGWKRAVSAALTHTHNIEYRYG